MSALTLTPPAPSLARRRPPEKRRRAEVEPFRVVLVDDVREDRELLGEWLEESALFVVVGEASDGPRGVEMASQLQPDLVTLDMSMPGGDGIAALRNILLNCPYTKVVIVSGFVTEELIEATVEMIGAAACLDKGIGSDRLVTELLGVVKSSMAMSGSFADLDGMRALTDAEFLINSRLAAIVESSGDAIIGKTLDGTIISWNAGAERLYGYPPDEILGKNVSLLIPDDREETFPHILEQVRRGSQIEIHEATRKRKDGSFVDVSLAVSPIRDKSGAIVGASTIARDVTARKLAEAELIRRAEELRRSNEELEQSAYIASHDLSEPLRSISGYVELLARRYEGMIDEEADHFIGGAVEGCTRMRQLIDDLLSYSRSGHTAELVATPTLAVLGEVLTSMASSLSATCGRVDYKDLPVVKGDRTTLVQLFQNLIANGIKFARPGIEPRLQIEAQRNDKTSWLFSVSDNGIGIAPEYRERVFGMFQRLHTRDAYPGTGIGLAICTKIVQAHDGQIWIDDEFAAGTRFCFTLPAVEERASNPSRLRF
jgi:PAS domain S-box-containing protein